MVDNASTVVITGNIYEDEDEETTTTTEKPEASEEKNGGNGGEPSKEGSDDEKEAIETSNREKKVLKETLTKLLALTKKLTEPLPSNTSLYPAEFVLRMDVSGSVGEILSDKSQYKRHWTVMKEDAGFEGISGGELEKKT